MKRWGWVLLAALLIPALQFGCSPSSDQGPPPVEEYDRTTEDNLMLFFANAYREKDLADYEEALDENFLFVFTEDIADSLGLPPDEPWWGKTEDLNSTKILFESETVTDIAFTYEYYTTWVDCIELRIEQTPSGPDTTRFSGLCCRLNPLIEVTTIVDNDEDPILKLRVDNSWLDVTVIPDPFNEDLWTVLKIEEIKKQL